MGSVGDAGVPQDESRSNVMEVDVLIVGAGPSGASLACFLASHGIKGLMISNWPSTSHIPKANYTNMAAFECLRAIGLEEDAKKVAYPISQFSTYHRICKSLAGEEIYRAYAFGNDPHRHGDYSDASPCEIMSLPQRELEPILIRYATQNGFVCRFDTELAAFQQHEDHVESTIIDLVTGNQTLVRSKYLCGADGASSKVVRELDLPMNDRKGGGLSINLLVEADLTHLVKDSPGLLHVMTRPDLPQPYYGILGMARFIKPWTEWVIVLICRPGTTKITATTEEIMTRARELLGDDNVDIKLKNMSIWRTNECYAEQYSKGRVHCLGDAVHRHPPQNGLGSNTCIQDAFNLSWKMAYVLKGLANPSLLKTYNDERQPIGKYIVGRANDTGRLHFALFKTLGLTETDPSRKSEIAAQFEQDSPEAQVRRNAFRRAVKGLDEERHALGAEMNQAYESLAVYLDDETPESRATLPVDEHLYCLNHISSSTPGFRVPHAWLQEVGRAKMVSTKDLCGHGRFTILTGIGGKNKWQTAVAKTKETTGVGISIATIGWGQEYQDTFFQWFEKRQIEEDGAILVRPDLVVAWRCKQAPTEERVRQDKLLQVMRRILGFQG
ncbi:hypothetical protein M409DRAFT_30522 [Zasmidium cellare ATCC 36951]|uniref:FAD-binding domain-containing protein n=1 Tax=Zasmidium cellare ATCC 36951 TaxID=1080233 RepID=A0A6A6BW14_ZASCE|nr:uncharacterized protein M409DRAFT_30522 [Zasmidium cellare ATCC 36951]KAF2158987.1 hypothetical protein M409DRAFT_30522 [Zasmidium cellare ATCC 36951]